MGAIEEDLRTSMSEVSVERKFPVVEIFGPTIQGEGALAGKVTHFVRFGGCDYSCVWCDSSHAVLPKFVRQAERLTTDEIIDRVSALGGDPDWVTLSGGNPVLHNLTELVRKLHHRLGYKVAVETQGTKWQDWLHEVDMLTISPKAPSSGMVASAKDFHNFIGNLPSLPDSTAVCVKVPVFDDRDLEWAKKLHMMYVLFPFYISIVTRMGGLFGDFDGGAIDTTEDIARRYRDMAEKVSNDPALGGVTILPQLHAIAWGHERGH
jgi:7-carboxy-7-deazaguanine synthase